MTTLNRKQPKTDYHVGLTGTGLNTRREAGSQLRAITALRSVKVQKPILEGFGVPTHSKSAGHSGEWQVSELEVATGVKSQPSQSAGPWRLR